jgi:hypothetical protein
MTVHTSKSYKKLDKNMQNMVNKAIVKLQTRYDEYKNQNIAITNIFGDSVIIHDIIDDEYYVYKCQVNNLQIRLLYEVTKRNNINVIYSFIKNGNNAIKKPIAKHNGDSYLKLFENVVRDYKKELLTQ